MNRENFIHMLNEKVKLIRNENGYTQNRMAEIIGISKKTLVEIEKERSSLGWTASVAVCSIFKESEILQFTFGGDTQDIIFSLTFDNCESKGGKTLGGKIWWKELDNSGLFSIQQNLISKHYRILDLKDNRISYSFDYDYIIKRYGELNGKQNRMLYNTWLWGES